MFNWILDISDRKLVGISFRMAIISALVIMVVSDRYKPIFTLYEESTAILEFLASAIIIPVTFEWINSRTYKKNIEENNI